MAELKIEYLPIDELVTYANNAKIHTAEQIEQIKKSIQEFSMNDPIAIWKNNEIIEGHGRLLALKELGYETVPVIRLDSLTDEQRKAYALVHNKLTMNTDFNVDLLEMELSDITDINMQDFGFLNVIDETEGEGFSESDVNFNYAEQYGVIVICDGEKEQEKVYNDLIQRGYNCKVVAV